MQTAGKKQSKRKDQWEGRKSRLQESDLPSQPPSFFHSACAARRMLGAFPPVSRIARKRAARQREQTTGK
jgi:hypothetical protein